MMKTLFKYTWAALAFCALASCSDNDTTSSNNGGSPIAPSNPGNGKELIDFSGDGSGITRASFTRAGFSAATKVVMRIKAEELTPSATPLAARYAVAEATATAQKPATGEDADTHSALVGEHSDLSYVAGLERYWDDAFGRNSKLTVWAFAIPGKTEATLPTWSQTGWTQVDSNTNPNWYTDDEEDVTVTWDVTTTQNGTTMETKDLTYSNNIGTGGVDGRYTHTWNSSTSVWDLAAEMGDGPMQWIAKELGSTTGKFDQGHLIFKRALSKIEIRLREGAGFNNSANSDFGWTKDQATATQNITLKGLFTNGTFNVSSGTWPTTNANDITQMYETTGTPANQTTRTVVAYVVPGNNLASTATNVIEFEIDNAKYYVTGTQIADAIKDYYKVGGEHENDEHAADYRDFTVTEQGKHYIIHLTVAKKGIERITAAIINWEEVNSSDSKAKNTYPEFALEDRGTRLVNANANEFNIYRKASRAENYIVDDSEKDYDWLKGYEMATKSWDATNNVWKTEWYWPDNLTYYHFRATGIYGGNASTPDPAVVDPTATAAASPTPTGSDYFNIYSGALSGSSYKDYLWGAPFKELDSPTPSANTEKLTYSTETGFDNTGTTHQISQAIGATESTINMLMFHMTSQITVNVTTTTDASAVVLQKNGGATDADKTKVEILNFQPNGTVLMGTGLVTATGTRGDAQMTYGTYNGTVSPVTYNNFTYGIVPQSLTWTTPTAGTIGLRITTPDGNQYVVSDLSSCTATVATNNLVNPYALATGSTTNYVIDRWYPNWKYTYNIAIKKTGIERITAAVVDWETVTGDLGTIDLEN